MTRRWTAFGAYAATLVAMGWSTSAGAAQFMVTNLNDAGAGSLRSAINQANGNGMADSITFATGGGGTINLQTPLPQLVNDVGCAASPCLVFEGNEAITLDGQSIPAGTAFSVGLRIAAPNVEVSNLTIVGFEDEGIVISGPGTTNILVSGCRIGIQNGSSGASLAVGDAGIAIRGGASDVRIQGNVISGYTRRAATESVGVLIEGGFGTFLSQNIIGLNETGDAAPLGTAVQMDYGVLARGAMDVFVGEDPGFPDVISGQGIAGIFADNSGPVTVGRVLVGTDVTGTIAFPNGASDPENGGGVVVSRSNFPLMVGFPGMPAVISGNRNCQVRVRSTMGGVLLENAILGLAADGQGTLAFSDGDFNVNGLCVESGSQGVGVGNGDPLFRNVIGGHLPTDGDCPDVCGAGILFQGVGTQGGGVINTSFGTSASTSNRYGVLVRDGASMLDVGVPGLPNVMGHSRVAAIAVVGAGSTGIRIGENILERSGRAEICLASSLEDCISHGLEGGGLRGNGGVAPPQFDADAFFAPTAQTEIELTGRTSGMGIVHVYRVPTVPHPSGAGGTAELIAELGVEPDFTFAQPIPALPGSESCLTATFTDDILGTSELAPNIRVALTDTPDDLGADRCRPDPETICSFGFQFENGVCVRSLKGCAQTPRVSLVLLLVVLLAVSQLRRRYELL